MRAYHIASPEPFRGCEKSFIRTLKNKMDISLNVLSQEPKSLLENVALYTCNGCQKFDLPKAVSFSRQG